MNASALALSLCLLGQTTVEPVPEDLRREIRRAAPAAQVDAPARSNSARSNPAQPNEDDAKSSKDKTFKIEEYEGRPGASARPTFEELMKDSKSATYKDTLRPEKSTIVPQRSVVGERIKPADTRPKSVPKTAIKTTPKTTIQTAPPTNRTPLTPQHQRPEVIGGRPAKFWAPDLIETALRPASSSQLKGRPFTLLEAIGRAGDRATQTRLTHTYWQLAAATANYHTSLDLLDRIKKLGTGRSQQDIEVLKAAVSAAEAEVADALAEAVSAQSELGEMLLITDADALPMVSDLLHVGTYSTRFTAIFANRPSSGQARRLDRVIPLRYRAVLFRAKAAVASARAEGEAVMSYGEGATSVDAVVSRIRRAGQQRRAFFAAVLAYNHDIADYALHVARQGTSGSALVAMLIRSRPRTPTPAPAIPDSKTSRKDGWVAPR